MHFREDSTPTAATEVDGYVANVPFDAGYRPEQSPPLLRLLTNAHAPWPAGRPLRYLDLGFGMGTSLAIHAAACPGEYWGCDINPAHVAAARELVRCAGTNVHTLEVSFASLLERSDLPSFDIVVAHGIWSWVSEANRAVILQILRRHLVPDGVFCLNSLVLPGATHGLPLQRLMRAHKRLAGGMTNADDLSASGLAFARGLQQAGVAHLAPGTDGGELLETLQRSDPNYLAHEYLNENWYPALFSDTAASLAAAGLQFVASADPVGNYDDLRFTEVQRAVLAAIEPVALRESAKDFLRPKRQRFDIFMKTDRPPSPCRLRVGRDERFVLGVSPAASLVGEHATAGAALKFDSPPFREIILALAAQGHRPKSFGQLVEVSSGAEDVAGRAIAILLTHDMVHPVHASSPPRETIAACHRLNGELLRRAQDGDEFPVLASPVAGHGVSVPRFQRLCLLAMRDGARTVEQWAKFAQEALKREGSSLAAEDVLKQALLFEASLPALTALGLIDAAD